MPSYARGPWLQADLTQFNADAAELNIKFLVGTIQWRAFIDMEQPHRALETLNELMDIRGQFDAIGNRANVMIQEATAMQNLLLVAEATTAYSLHAIILMTSLRGSPMQTGSPAPVSADETKSLLGLLSHASHCYEAIGRDEGKVRVKLLEARLHDLCDGIPDRNASANQALALAEAMGYDEHANMAREIIAGRSEYRQLLELSNMPADVDDRQAAQTDEEVRQFAAGFLELAGLPPERLPVVEREAFSARAILREKRTWCRHIELHQDRRHQLSPATHYLTDPPRIGICLRHKHKSRVASSDWATVIRTFKDCYCTNCPDREPERPLPTASS